MGDRGHKEAASALYFLHTSPIMTAVPSNGIKLTVPAFTLDYKQTPMPLYPNYIPAPKREPEDDNDDEFADAPSHDAAGLLCSLMSHQGSSRSNGASAKGRGGKRKSPRAAINGSKKKIANRNRAGSMMSLATDDGGDDAVLYDQDGIIDVEKTAKNGRIGAYSPASRRKLIEKYLKKRQNRIWKKRIKYGVRKSFADSRLRVKGRFVKKEDEGILKDMMSII